MKPTVAGIPASDSIAIVIGHASHGERRPRPDIEAMSSPTGGETPSSRSIATITANAARFIPR